jgi:hypothetical protein
MGSRSSQPWRVVSMKKIAVARARRDSLNGSSSAPGSRRRASSSIRARARARQLPHRPIVLAVTR